MAYHHGELPDALLAAAAAAIDREGPAALSLRSLAKEVGVSHTAPRHHFGDKRGVLTALASQGYRLLTDQLTSATQDGGLLSAGIAYVAFAQDRPGHFAVMFQPALVDPEDQDLASARAALGQALRSAVGSTTGDGEADQTLGLAAWSIAHGFATLAKAGAIAAEGDLETLAAAMLSHLSV